MSNIDSGEIWAVRAAACELSAFSLRYPALELANAVASGEWAEAAEEIAAALGVELPEGFAADARDAAGKNADELLHTLRAEATHLFVGAPEPACSPYEGVWRAADDGVQALLFVNPHSMEVERFCKSCGLGRPEGTNEPLDHAATELELLQYLASLAAGIVVLPEDGPAACDLPGGSSAAACEEFLQEHVLAWMPRFAASMAQEARVPFYRAAAHLLEAFLRAMAPDAVEAAAAAEVASCGGEAADGEAVAREGSASDSVSDSAAI